MKLLIVRSAQLSSWGSCKVISPNLQSTYKLLSAPFQVSWFDMPIDYKKQELDTAATPVLDLAKAIEMQKPDQLIFIDHLPCPADILLKLTLIIEPRKLPPVVVHVYGDFTYFSKDWLDLAGKLRHHPLKFITASASQKRLVDFFCEDNTSTEAFCFPVNSDDYYFDKEARLEERKKQNIHEEDIVILYSGRISLQKNIDILLQEYLEMLKNETVNIHLWIAGAFDDIGAPFMGIKTTEGYLYSKLNAIISHHPKQYTKNIKFLGLQNKDELRKIKSAADLFVSFSLYHDEDFGMSPAEAMACGLPSLLTDWGGYSSFESTKWRCKLAPVRITEFGVEIHADTLKESIAAHKETYVTAVDRERWSKEFHNEFSIINSVKKLEVILNKPFQKFSGFNWAMAPFSHTYGKYSLPKTINPDSCPSNKNFYFQVYKNYISKEDNSKNFFKVVQWTYDYIQNMHQETGMPIGRKIRANHHYLKPFSLDYYCPANPVLLGGYLTKKLTSKQVWMIRDGIVPVTFFFREHSPETTSGVVAIHKDLHFLVPENWQNNVVFYSVETKTFYNSEKKPKRILISGMADPSFSDIDEFKKCLGKLKNTFGNELQNIPVTVLLPSKKNNLWGKRTEESGLEYSRILTSEISNSVHFVDWNDLKNENDFKGCLYFEINSGWFIKDSFVKYFVLSNGAGLLEESTKIMGPVVNEHQISVYHSVKFFNPEFSKLPAYCDPFEADAFSYFQDICKGQIKSIRISSNWESWYPLYLKKYYSAYSHEI